MEITAPITRSASGRQRYSLEFQLQFLQAWDEASGTRGAQTRLARQYGIDRTVVRVWLEKRESGFYEEAMVAEASKPKSWRQTTNEARAENARLKLENERLKKKVAQAEAAQEIMGKAYELLEGVTTGSEPKPEDQIPPALMSSEQYRQWLSRHIIR